MVMGMEFHTVAVMDIPMVTLMDTLMDTLTGTLTGTLMKTLMGTLMNTLMIIITLIQNPTFTTMKNTSKTIKFMDRLILNNQLSKLIAPIYVMKIRPDYLI